MKKILLALSACLLFSCGASIQVPDEMERRGYNENTIRLTVPAVIDSDIAEDRKIQINTGSKSYEAFALMNYLIPLLDDRDHLSLGFWFLDGNSDSEILSWLKDEAGAPSSQDLLFNTNPVLTGYIPFTEFLDGLKRFYQDLEDPESMTITTSEDAFIRFELFENGSFEGSRRQYLIHSPVINSKGHWELPFKGQLYFMMIHDWLLERFSVIPLKDSFLEDSYLTSVDEKNSRTIGSYMDGIILMGKESLYEPFPKIESFITEENIPQALEFFPRQIIREKTNPATYLVNKKISGRHRRSSRRLEKLYSLITELEPAAEE